MTKHGKTNNPPGDGNARRLFKEHMKWARFIAISMCSTLPLDIDFDDVVQEAYLALWWAATKFDAERGKSFKSWAESRVRGAVIDYIRKHRKGAKSAIYSKKTVNKIMDAAQMEFADSTKLAAFAHLRRSRIRQPRGKHRAAARIRLPSDRSRISPDWNVASKDVTLALVRSIRKLPKRYILILYLYYIRELNQVEIGLVLGVNESSVSQLRNRALKKLYKMLNNLGYCPANF